MEWFSFSVVKLMEIIANLAPWRQGLIATYSRTILRRETPEGLCAMFVSNSFGSQFSIVKKNKGKRKIQGVPQSQTAALPGHQKPIGSSNCSYSSQFSIVKKNKGKRKIQGVPQSQTAALPGHQKPIGSSNCSYNQINCLIIIKTK